MSTLVLVRHGQASFFEADYDKLSPLGEEQARKLGEYWAREGVAFDEVHVGTLKRQARTAEVAGEAMRAAGMPWPAPTVSAAFNEYDADSVMKRLLPELARLDESFARLDAARATAATPSEKYKTFHRLLEAVMKHWVEGEIEAGGYETWREFSGRVRGGLRAITDGRDGGKRIALFTSGGPIGVAVQTVMGAPDQRALEINWRVRNGSLTEIVFGAGRRTLDAFNTITHLDEPRLLTYR